MTDNPTPRPLVKRALHLAAWLDAVIEHEEVEDNRSGFIACAKVLRALASEPPVGTRERLLTDYVDIVDPAIGVARLALQQGKPEKAMKWLDGAVDKLNALAASASPSAGGVTGAERHFVFAYRDRYRVGHDDWTEWKNWEFTFHDPTLTPAAAKGRDREIVSLVKAAAAEQPRTVEGQ